jgi:hypothetical protein
MRSIDDGDEASAPNTALPPVNDADHALACERVPLGGVGVAAVRANNHDSVEQNLDGGGVRARCIAPSTVGRYRSYLRVSTRA